MADSKEEEKLTRLRELVKRNRQLDKQLEELLGQYQSLNSRDEQYKQLLREFGLDDESQKGKQGVRHFKMASMVFIVVRGFKDLAAAPDAPKQLDLLDELFITISDIATKYGLAKIPTVGDNMLLCGGIERENKTNPIDAAIAATEITEWVAKFKKSQRVIWDIQVGIHTGPVIGRYSGKRKLPYTLSGNNVLIVTRLALLAEPGGVFVSPMTSELVKEFFEVAECSKIPVRYGSEMKVFKLLALRPELVNTDPEKKWSDAFDLYYSRVQFMDIQEYMLDMLEQQLPKFLYYHNVKHTIDVTTEVELIGWAEGLKESDILLLKVAGLFHDTGQIQCDKGHENVSCQYVDEILPTYGYSQDKIATIKRIIMATQLPHTPTDILEAVIQDADLDYLGRADFIPVSNLLYKEIVERGGSNMTINQWNKIQIKFISSHQYYTKTAQSLREVNKQSQIERLKELVEESDKNGIE